jgi:hypothetical protein
VLLLPPHFVEHPVELISGLPNTVAIVAINHEDQALRVLKVVPPERTDLQGSGTLRLSCLTV